MAPKKRMPQMARKANPGKDGRFVKGDPRINRNGRPAGFDELRELAKMIANKEAVDKDGNPLYEPGESKEGRITKVEAILIDMSNDPKRQAEFLQIAYGKVPNETKVKVEQEITVELVTPKREQPRLPDNPDLVVPFCDCDGEQTCPICEESQIPADLD